MQYGSQSVFWPYGHECLNIRFIFMRFNDRLVAIIWNQVAAEELRAEPGSDNQGSHVYLGHLTDPVSMTAQYAI